LTASLLFLAGHFSAQQQTINSKPATTREVAATHKVLLIPFEPRLYMSEVDRNINAETKQSAREIRHRFRDGLNEQVYKALRASKYGALDLMEDTAMYKKDLVSLYQGLGYEYMRIPDQKNYRPPVKDKDVKKVEKGQLIVETNSDLRFMNARLRNEKVLLSLQAKYKTDLFLFINELDLKASGYKNPGELGEGSTNRTIIVHYTLFNAQGLELNSGVVEETFDPELNNPKRIVDKHFSKIALILVQRINKAVTAANN
jgi:hypothetical protein